MRCCNDCEFWKEAFNSSLSNFASLIDPLLHSAARTTVHATARSRGPFRIDIAKTYDAERLETVRKEGEGQKIKKIGRRLGITVEDFR